MLLLKEYNESGLVDFVVESTNDGKKDLFIKGVFAEAELKNRNGRIYPRKIMADAVAEYKAEFVDKRRALGELSHPENRPMVKPEFASHLITELEMVGDKVLGKAKILDTPQGQIVRGLLTGGVQLGVSTRALGSLREENGVKFVGPDLKMYSVDIVSDPSSINAWVDAVNESQEWLVMDDGRIIEKYQKEIRKQKIDEGKALDLFANFLSDIAKIR